jgi:hypothetical protein
MSYKAFIIFIIFLTLYSCSKEPNPAQQSIEKKKISLRLTYYTDSAYQNFELIVSTTGGEVILDTIAKGNTISFIEFYTNEKKLDLSFISYTSNNNKFNVVTYRAVDPTSWDIVEIPEFGYLSINRQSTGSSPIPAFIQYINPPFFTGPPYFTSYIGGSFTIVRYSASGINAQYQWRKGIPTYLLLPEQGYYKIHVPQSNKDTVDLAGMRKVNRRPFDFTPAQIGDFAILHGITDTLDRNKDIELFNYSINSKMPELLYPVEPFQKYHFLVGATGISNELYALYSYGDSIPKIYDLFTAADYSISSTNADNFSVSFKNAKPFYYRTQWESDQMNWQIYSPVEFNQFNPISMLNNMKSKLLVYTNIKSIKLSEFMSERSKTMDYNGYMSKQMNFAERLKTPDYTTVLYVKTY